MLQICCASRACLIRPDVFFEKIQFRFQFLTLTGRNKNIFIEGSNEGTRVVPTHSSPAESFRSGTGLVGNSEHVAKDFDSGILFPRDLLIALGNLESDLSQELYNEN
jgi:hypothetical protein